MRKAWRTTSLVLGTLLPACTLVTSLDGYAEPSTAAADASTDRAVIAEDAAIVANSTDAADATALSYRDTVLADQPIAYFRLGEGSTSTIARDEVTNQTGNIVGAVTREEPGGIAGETDTSMAFEGNGSVQLPGSTMSFSALAPFSLECWIKPSVVDQNYRRILTNEGADDAGRQGWLLWVVDRTNGGVGLERYVNGKGDGVLSRSVPPSDRWTYVVGTYDGALLSLFVDGVLVDRSGSTRPLVGQSTFAIGAGFSSGIVGGIDEVAVYGRVLPADRIAAHYARGRAAR